MSGGTQGAADRRAALAWRRERGNPLRVAMAAAEAGATPDDMRAVKELGLPWGALAGRRLLGFVTGSADARAEYWQADEGGVRMLVAPVEEGGTITDLIAFAPEAPDSWFASSGAGWALGHDAIVRAGRDWGDGARLWLHASPVEWLRAGGAGACVVRWGDEARAALREVPRIQVTQVDFQRFLRVELLRQTRLPEVEVGRWRSAA